MTPEPRGVPVVVELHPTLARACGKPALAAALDGRLRALLADLGIAGPPMVAVTTQTSSRIVRIRAHDRRIRFDPDLMNRAWLAVAPGDVADHVDAEAAAGAFPDAWLRRETRDAHDDPSRSRLRSFVVELVAAALLERPSILVGPEQAAEYAARCGAAHARPAVAAMMRGLLDLGISMRGKEHVVRERVELTAASGEDAVENAFTFLRRRDVLLHAHPDHLARLAGGRPLSGDVSVYDAVFHEAIRKAFEASERRVLEERGVGVPGLTWRPDARVADGSVALQINDMVGLSTPSLGPGEPLEDELIRRAPYLLGIEDVEFRLAELDLVFPVLARSTMALVDLHELTRTLRGLLADGVSIRDLRTILERLLRYESVTLDSRYLAPEDRLPVSGGGGAAWTWREAREFVRAGLRDALTWRYGYDHENVFAFTLSAPLERRLARAAPRLSETQEDALLDALWSRLDADSILRRPVLVTSPAGRARLQEVVASELPMLPVLARSELRPGVRVAELGTISVSG